MGSRARIVPLAVAATVGGCLLLGIAPAHADDFPSWSEVQQARANADSKAHEVAKIRALLSNSEAQAARTEHAAEQRGAAYQAVQDRVAAAGAQLAVIREQVEKAERAAVRAAQRAGLLAAQLARTGGADPQTALLLDSGSSDADAFLAKLGDLSRLARSNSAIADRAEQARNIAAATGDRLKAAEAALVVLRRQAQQAYAAAVAANETANAQVQHEQQVQATLAAQLRVLRSASAVTFADYRRGLAAASAGGAAGVAGDVMPSGWALPAAGPITDPFGYRPDRPAGANPFHHGVDIGGGCASPIYAAHDGTVIYAGWYGTYGNFIEVGHGDGLSTGYAHIRPGGTFVHVGERVKAGQNIASIGTTGASTGCHLHFEVRLNEVPTDPVPFMSARGVTIG